jgi:hypothetical protein
MAVTARFERQDFNQSGQTNLCMVVLQASTASYCILCLCFPVNSVESTTTTSDGAPLSLEHFCPTYFCMRPEGGGSLWSSRLRVPYSQEFAASTTGTCSLQLHQTVATV